MYQMVLSLSEIGEKISKAVDDYKELISNVDWIEVATVVIAGIVIVLGVLLVLIGVFGSFGKLVSGLENSAKKRKARRAARKAAKQAAKEKAGEAAVAVICETDVPSASEKEAENRRPVLSAAEEQGVSGEVVAAITAAIAASEGSNNFVIRSVKRKDAGSRNPWARAAVADNTRAF
ncbi:MAG: OadG family protein [Eubacterium sp.]